MDFPEGIEGDYLETKDNHLFFDVKGLLHPKDRKICFIRFYPDPAGDRVKEGISYKKIYELEERYDFLQASFPQYLFYSEQLGLELQGVKNEDIKRIYTPRDYLKTLREKSNLNRIEKISLELCNIFINEGGVPENSIGITGSVMIGLNKEQSDIDLVVYGTQVSLDFQEKLASLLCSGRYCRQYNLDEYHTHYTWRVGGSNIAFDDFMYCEQRKLHQGMYKGFEFFIRYLKSPDDWLGSYKDFKYQNCGRIEVMAEVIDATESIFTPCSYKINTLKISDDNKRKIDIKKTEIIEVSSFRGRFCEHANKGEIVKIEGKLEKVNIKDSHYFYRILLQDQKRDKMLVIQK